MAEPLPGDWGTGPSTSDADSYFLNYAATTVQRYWKGYRERRRYVEKVRDSPGLLDGDCMSTRGSEPDPRL